MYCKLPSPMPNFSFSKKLAIFHEIQSIENIKIFFFGQNQSISHQVSPGCSSGHIVEGVGSLDGVVVGVIHYSRWERIETNKVRHFASSCRILHYISLDDVFLG